jgi:transposase
MICTGKPRSRSFCDAVSFPRFSGHPFCGDTGRLGRSLDACTAPAEFRRRAVELAREKAAPVAQIAKDLGISESCLRNWMARAEVDESRKEGLSSDERKELVALRRDKRRLETENEILRRAAALFARDGIVPK